ncbi:uncharacterized protein CLUP02_13486 [Colletotrichum lupini]|uniref:Uncharacterized protein n=1 Tax=Colletotrichum lupini TaxID=145971 RepID=A0A9Q8WMD3_9PEZI|nr:uncharacterized protein CLUP02_13486 [Colletotrichum lupini]UQC87965.1 hypothetical protein CLUP02_13486 [Colletotrichum lupini]
MFPKGAHTIAISVEMGVIGYKRVVGGGGLAKAQSPDNAKWSFCPVFFPQETKERKEGRRRTPRKVKKTEPREEIVQRQFGDLLPFSYSPYGAWESRGKRVPARPNASLPLPDLRIRGAGACHRGGDRDTKACGTMALGWADGDTNVPPSHSKTWKATQEASSLQASLRMPQAPNLEFKQTRQRNTFLKRTSSRNTKPWRKESHTQMKVIEQDTTRPHYPSLMEIAVADPHLDNRDCRRLAKRPSACPDTTQNVSHGAMVPWHITYPEPGSRVGKGDRTNITPQVLDYLFVPHHNAEPNELNAELNADQGVRRGVTIWAKLKTQRSTCGFPCATTHFTNDAVKTTRTGNPQRSLGLTHPIPLLDCPRSRKQANSERKRGCALLGFLMENMLTLLVYVFVCPPNSGEGTGPDPYSAAKHGGFGESSWVPAFICLTVTQRPAQSVLQADIRSCLACCLAMLCHRATVSNNVADC